MFLELDVGSSQSVNQALSATIDQMKRPPTVIVNSAGITRDGFLLKMSENDFDSVINVNLKVNMRGSMNGWPRCYIIQNATLDYANYIFYL